MMATILIFIIVSLAVLYLMEPLGRRLPWTFGKGLGAIRLKERKEAALLAIHDIDFEYAAGRLTPEEYRRLREAFKKEAIEAIKEIDMDLEPPEGVSRELHQAIKREVLRLKKEMALLVLFLLVPLQLFAAEVKVRVENGTLKAPQTGASVILYVLEQDGKAHKVKEKLKGVTDSNGVARFSLDVPSGKKLLAMPLVEYRGIPYRGGGIDLSKGDGEVRIKVFEISDEEGLIEIEKRDVFVERVKGEGIYMVDVLTIKNRGNKTYVGRYNDSTKMNETVKVGLPPGYEQPTLDGDVDLNEVVPMTDGLVLQEAIPPGEKTLWLTYRVRSEIGRFDLQFPITTPYRVFRFYFPRGVDWKVKVKGLREAGTAELQGRSFLRWEGRDIGKDVKGDDESLPYILSPKITIYDPSRYRLIGRNEIAIILALISSIIAGLFYIRMSRGREMEREAGALKEERDRLSTLLERLEREIGNNEEARRFYAPYRDLLLMRIEEINRTIYEDHH